MLFCTLKTRNPQLDKSQPISGWNSTAQPETKHWFQGSWANILTKAACLLCHDWEKEPQLLKSKTGGGFNLSRRRIHHFFLTVTPPLLSSTEILGTFCPSCFAMLALTHHSYLFLSNNLKLFIRVLISKFHLKVEVPILDLHVKTMNQCNLGVD